MPSVRRLSSSGGKALAPAGTTPLPVSTAASASLIAASSHECPRGSRQGIGEAVDFLMGVVHRKRGPASGGHAITGEERLGAMGASTHGHPIAVDHRRNVMRVRALHGEGQYGALLA